MIARWELWIILMTWKQTCYKSLHCTKYPSTILITEFLKSWFENLKKRLEYDKYNKYIGNIKKID